ncbi:MAG: hypothetical protein ACM3U1_01060 [Chloroflexota bacterium]
MKEDVYAMLQFEELTPDMQMLAEVCGMDVMRKILREFGGIFLYVPKVTSFKKFLKRMIAERESMPRCKLASLLGVSSMTLRKLARE